MEFIFQRLNYERLSPESYVHEDFRLARMSELLERLGSPHLATPVVHVAGTKGKGSTSAMLAAMLRAAGLRTGLFISPHLVDYEERMTVDGERPGLEELEELIALLRPVVEQLDRRDPGAAPTYFEVTTALGWLLFQSRKCEIAVMEVGLGGRLDSTNICRPLACIITSISRDHQRLLGDSLGQTAREKAGIIKPGVPVFSGAAQPEAADVVAVVAGEQGAPLHRLEAEILVHDAARRDADEVSPIYEARIDTPWRRHLRLAAPLPGRHQLDNLALAASAFDGLAQQDSRLTPAALRRGLSLVRWPARIEFVSTAPHVVIDAAHNDGSIEALCRTLAEVRARRRILIFGTSRDKDVAAMLELLDRQFDVVILTRYEKNPRALPVEQLQVLAAERLHGDVHVAVPISRAWELARGLAGSEDLIVIAGSLFLAAEFRSLLCGESR